MLHAPNGPVAFTFSVSDAVAGEILSFLALPQGWCHGYGRPANINAALRALRFLILLRELEYDRLEVFPDPDGGVLLSAFFGQIRRSAVPRGRII